MIYRILAAAAAGALGGALGVNVAGAIKGKLPQAKVGE